MARRRAGTAAAALPEAKESQAEQAPVKVVRVTKTPVAKDKGAKGKGAIAPTLGHTIVCESPDASVDSEEAATAIAALEANAQIAPEGAPLAPGQTHQMVRQPDGKLVPVRRRFSSI